MNAQNLLLLSLLTRYNTTFSISISAISLSVSQIKFASFFYLCLLRIIHSSCLASLGAQRSVLACNLWSLLEVVARTAPSPRFNAISFAPIIFFIASSVESQIEKTKPIRTAPLMTYWDSYNMACTEWGGYVRVERYRRYKVHKKLCLWKHERFTLFAFSCWESAQKNKSQESFPNQINTDFIIILNTYGVQISWLRRITLWWQNVVTMFPSHMLTRTMGFAENVILTLHTL